MCHFTLMGQRSDRNKCGSSPEELAQRPTICTFFKTIHLPNWRSVHRRGTPRCGCGMLELCAVLRKMTAETL